MVTDHKESRTDEPITDHGYVKKYTFYLTEGEAKDNYYVMLYSRFSPLHETYITTILKEPNRPCIMYFYDAMPAWRIALDAVRFASYLSELGVGKGTKVAIQLQNLPEFVITQLGSLILGCTIVPINVMLKRDELLYVLKQSDVKVFVGHHAEVAENLQPILPETRTETIILCDPLHYLTNIPDRLENFRNVRNKMEKTGLAGLIVKSYDEIMKNSSINTSPETTSTESVANRILSAYEELKVDIVPFDTAEVLFTSGTTGQPKGAIYNHYNLVFVANTFKEVWGINSDDVVIALSPLFHNIGQVFYIYSMFYINFRLVLMFRFDPTDALRLIDKWRVTTTLAPTTAFVALMNHPEFNKYNLSSLKKTFSGGSPTPAEVSRRWRELVGSNLINALGATETCGPISFNPYFIAEPFDPQTESLSVGKPIPGLNLRLTDPSSGKVLGVDEVGEIQVRGPNVISGYYDMDDQTRFKYFTSDGWFRTGDLGKLDERGYLYYVDRLKDIINFSGFKIWPREVEDVLYKHPAVKEVAVVGVKDSYHGEIPKAFVVLREGFKGKVTENELVQFVRERLANYKVPRAVEFVDELPKSSTGKILRRVLRGDNV